MLKGTKSGRRSRIFRTLAIVLALVLVAGSLPAGAASAKTVEVKTKKKLLAEIAKSAASTITFTTQKAYKFTIPASDAGSNKKIVINAPNATLTNKSSLKGITLNGIKEFTEKGSGNSITVKAEGAQITVSKGVDVKKLSVASNKVSVDVKGKAKVENLVCNLKNAEITVTAAKKADVNITLNKKTKLTVAGEKGADVDIVSKAKNSSVTASVPVEITAEKNLKLKLNKGAEGSVVDSKSEDVKVSVSGKAADELTEKVAGETVKEPEKKDDTKEKTEEKKEEKKAAEVSTSDSYSSYTDPNLCSDERTLLSRLEAYKDANYDVTVTYRTSEEAKVVIPEGNYPGVTLVVDAPKATITNNATYKKVEIHNISSDTWVEQAIANIIALFAPKAHIVIAEGGSGTSLEIGRGVNSAVIENNGTGASIANVSINANAVGTAVRFTGTNNIPFPVKNESAGAVLTTQVQINLNTVVSVKLQVLPGGENSEVVCQKDDDVSIYGVGNITVTNETSGEVYEVTGAQIEDEALKEELAAVTGKINGMTKVTSGSAISATVAVYNYSTGFSAATATPVATKTAGADGSYSIDGLPFGNYILIFSAEGYMNAEAIVPLTNSEKNIGSTVLITASELKGTLWGTLDDSTAQGGRVIDEPGITIKLRKGLDNVSGTVYRETITDDDGEYFFRDIEAGYYTVQVADTRTDAEEICVRTYMNVVFEGGEKKISITVNLQEVKKEIVGGEGELQFILGWGREKDDGSVPSDLDSHLTGPTADLASRFHVYYSDKKYTENGLDYADLDRDDTTYEGPETTTVRISSNGIYHFYVYDFTDRHDVDNTRLSSSEAWVKIYRGTKELGVYYVPTGKIGTIWDVCTYDMNTNSLNLINNVYLHPGDSDDVGMTPLEMFRENGFKLSNVTDGENDIYWHKYENDPDGNNYILVFGENEHFGSNPEFTFRATDVTVDYRAAETVTEYVVGTLTVTFAGETRIYKVVYYDTTDAFDDIGFEAEGLFDDDEVLDLEWRKVTVDGEEVDEYFITVMGDKEPVTPNVTFENKEKGEVSYTYESVTGKDYVGIIHASYKHFKCDIHVYLSPKTYAFSFVMVKDAEYPVEEYLYTGAMPDDQAETVDPYMYYGYIKLPTVTGTVSGPSIQFAREDVTVTSYEDLTPAEPGEPIGVFNATYGKFTCRIYIVPINLIPEASKIGTYSGEDADTEIEWHDANLKAAVAEKLGVASDAAIKVKDVYGITILDISNRGITTIEDISNFKNIRYLNASNNNITTAKETIFNINSHRNDCYVDISGNDISEDEVEDISERFWFYTYLKYEPQKDPKQ